MSLAADFAGYAAYKVFEALFALLPRRVCLAAGAGFGRLAFRFDRKHRAIALDNLRTAFGGERPSGDLAEIARGSFENLGRSLAEVVSLAHVRRARARRLVDVEGAAHLVAARARGRGALVFTAHFGSWEMSLTPLAEIGPLSVIARPLDNVFIERDLARVRTRHGAKIISKFGAARAVLRALAAGETVAVLIDQNVQRREAVFVDFFGRPAATTPALAAFHLASGAPIVPMFCEPGPGSRYRLRFLPPLEFPPGPDRGADVLKITRTCTKMIEAAIRRSPELWLWAHRRWHTRPPGTP